MHVISEGHYVKHDRGHLHVHKRWRLLNHALECQVEAKLPSLTYTLPSKYLSLLLIMQVDMNQDISRHLHIKKLLMD